MHVAATELSRTLSLHVEVAYYKLAFGISIEQLLPGSNLTTSSGIMWTDCVYISHTGKWH